MEKIGVILDGKTKIFHELTKTALQSGAIYYERHQSIMVEYFYMDALTKESVLQIPKQFLGENCLFIIENLSLEIALSIKQIMPRACILTQCFLDQILKTKEGIFIGKLLELTSIQINEAILLFHYINHKGIDLSENPLCSIWYGAVLREEGAFKIMQILLEHTAYSKKDSRIKLQLLASAQVPVHWKYELEEAIVQYFNEEILFEVTTGCVEVQTDQIYYVIKTF